LVASILFYRSSTTTTKKTAITGRRSIRPPSCLLGGVRAFPLADYQIRGERALATKRKLRRIGIGAKLNAIVALCQDLVMPGQSRA
jgi:hypothetical protein